MENRVGPTFKALVIIGLFALLALPTLVCLVLFFSTSACVSISPQMQKMLSNASNADKANFLYKSSLLIIRPVFIVYSYFKTVLRGSRSRGRTLTQESILPKYFWSYKSVTHFLRIQVTSYKCIRAKNMLDSTICHSCNI